jgi:hypothetical protein
LCTEEKRVVAEFSLKKKKDLRRQWSKNLSSTVRKTVYLEFLIQRKYLSKR